MSSYRLQRLKQNKKVAASVVRRFEAPRKSKLYQQIYERRFQRQQSTNQGKANVYRGKSKRNQLSLFSSDVKPEEAMNE